VRAWGVVGTDDGAHRQRWSSWHAAPASLQRGWWEFNMRNHWVLNSSAAAPARTSGVVFSAAHRGPVPTRLPARRATRERRWAPAGAAFLGGRAIDSRASPPAPPLPLFWTVVTSVRLPFAACAPLPAALLYAGNGHVVCAAEFGVDTSIGTRAAPTPAWGRAAAVHGHFSAQNSWTSEAHRVNSPPSSKLVSRRYAELQMEG
jgi:hypothetical protein